MLLQAGGTAVAFFHVKDVDGNYGALTLTAQVYRNGVLTTVPVSVTASSEPGAYLTSFTVPANWQGYDQASIRIVVDPNNGTDVVSFTKPAGTIAAAGIDDSQELTLDRIADLLEADQVIENGYLVYYQSGTTNELMRKLITGTTCADDVALRESA